MINFDFLGSLTGDQEHDLLVDLLLMLEKHAKPAIADDSIIWDMHERVREARNLAAHQEQG